MENFAQEIQRNWPLRRVIGLIIGVFVAVQAMLYKDALLGVLSAFFIFQIATNTGCFGSSACSIDYPTNINNRTNE